MSFIRSVRIGLASVVVLLSCGIAAAQEKPLLDYKEVTLDNGLKVITLEDVSCPVVDVEMWYHVGSKNESADRQGFAHMFEHMMFRGTDRLGPTDHFDFLRRAGGWCNGSTGFDRTRYYEVVPSNQLPLALWLEAERMSSLKIDQAAYDTERKVVEEERRMGLNQPFGTLVEQGLTEVFKTHPYRWPPIGKIAHLRASSVPELREFWIKYYTPNDATLVIVGDIKHADAQALAKKYFGWIPRGATIEPVKVDEPLPANPRSVTLHEKNAPTPLVGLVYRTVPESHKDQPALELLCTILGDGASSRLYRDLVAQEQIAVKVSAMNETLEQQGMLIAGAVLPPIGGDANKVQAALEAQIARIRTEKVADVELTKARNQALRDMVTATLTVGGKASMLGQSAVVLGDASRVNRAIADIKAVTADDILRVAQTYLDPNRVLKVTVERDLTGTAWNLLGKTEEEAKITAEPEKTAPPPGRGVTRPEDFPAKPPLAKIGDLNITPKFSRQALANGLKVMIVPNNEVPYVTMSLGLLSGAYTEQKVGSCSLALSMLTKGSARHTEAELATELETYAIGLSGSGGMDSGMISASCLSEHLDRTMGLLAEVAMKPAFPADEFDKLRKRVRADLAMSAANPSYIADREFDRRLFGEHPYARTARGELADVDALTVADLQQWYATFARPDLAVLIVAGDVTEKQALELAEKNFGSWKADGPKPEVKLPALPKATATQIFLVDRPDCVQSQIRVGQLSITRQHPDYFTSRIVDGYFGRGFGSRLNRSVRVDKGLTYGIWGGTVPARFAGNFNIGTFSKTESTGKAVQAILEETARLHAVPPTQEEIDDTCSYIVGNFPAGRETPQQVAGDLWLIEQEGLPTDYFQQLLSKVTKVTADDCMKMVGTCVDCSKLTIVVVGNAAKIQKDLEAIAPVTLISSPAASQPASGPGAN